MHLHSFRPLLAVAIAPIAVTVAACSSSDPAVGCVAPQADASPDVAQETAADAIAQDDAPPADASDGAVAKTPAHAVTSLAIAAGKGGFVVAYATRCEGCGNPWLGDTVDGRALSVALDAADPGRVVQLVDPAELKDPKRPPVVVSASSLGDDLSVLWEEQDGSLVVRGASLLGGALPGGSVVSAARISTNFTVGKQTQGATFGEKVNAGLVTTSGANDAWIAAYDATNAGQLTAVHVQGGAVVDTRAPAASAQTASLFFPPGGKLPVAAWSAALPGADGDVVANVFGGALGAPVRGVPVAVWSNGAGAGRVAVQQADGGVWIWDGKNTLRASRADEAACSAVTFDGAGNAIVAQVGPRSTVLYVQKESDLQTPIVLATGTTPIDLAHVRNEFGINEQGVKRCGVATNGSVVYVAWSEPGAAATGREAGLPNEIDVVAYDRSSISNVLKTKHDTAKNSISNVR
jgi:hypothetical protein